MKKPVILRCAQNLTRHARILRCAQNDNVDGSIKLDRALV